MAKTETTELVVSGIDKGSIERIASFQEALNLAAGANLTQETLVYEASGYPLLDNKDKLEGVPFLITQVKWGESKKFKNGEGIGNRFVILYVITKDDEKWTVTDGSTGIAAQCEEMVAEREANGIVPSDQMFFIKNGLTRSDYEYTDPNTGNVSDASTYYFA